MDFYVQGQITSKSVSYITVISAKRHISN